MSRHQLKDQWRDLFKAAPPAAFTPDLLVRGIAWRLQERVLGGLSGEARRLLGSGGGGARALAKRRASRPLLRPGNRLVRRWRGRTYVVEVGEDGLHYDGTRFSSLTVIATKITGRPVTWVSVEQGPRSLLMKAVFRERQINQSVASGKQLRLGFLADRIEQARAAGPLGEVVTHVAGFTREKDRLLCH